MVDVSAKGKQTINQAVPSKMRSYVKTRTVMSSALHPRDNDKMNKRMWNFQMELAKAKLVITSRIHVAMPCVAYGTPVIFVSGTLPGGGGGRATGLTPMFHTLDPSNISAIADFDFENPPPNPNCHVAQTFRRRLFDHLEQSNSSLMRENLRLYDMRNIHPCPSHESCTHTTEC